MLEGEIVSGLAGVEGDAVVRTARLREVAEIVSGATPKTSIEDYWGRRHGATPLTSASLMVRASIRPPHHHGAGLRSCAAQVLPTDLSYFSSRNRSCHVAINANPMATNQGFKSLIPAPRPRRREIPLPLASRQRGVSPKPR